MRTSHTSLDPIAVILESKYPTIFLWPTRSFCKSTNTHSRAWTPNREIKNSAMNGWSLKIFLIKIWHTTEGKMNYFFIVWMHRSCKNVTGINHSSPAEGAAMNSWNQRQWALISMNAALAAEHRCSASLFSCHYPPTESTRFIRSFWWTSLAW